MGEAFLRSLNDKVNTANFRRKTYLANHVPTFWTVASQTLVQQPLRAILLEDTRVLLIQNGSWLTLAYAGKQTLTRLMTDLGASQAVILRVSY